MQYGYSALNLLFNDIDEIETFHLSSSSHLLFLNVPILSDFIGFPSASTILLALGYRVFRFIIRRCLSRFTQINDLRNLEKMSCNSKGIC